MPREKRVRRQASYRAGVQWIAENDNRGSDRVLIENAPPDYLHLLHETVAGYISTLLLADLFGAEPLLVASDVIAERRKIEIAEAAPAASPEGPASKLKLVTEENHAS